MPENIRIRVVDPENGYSYITLEELKEGDRWQFDFPNDLKDENHLGSDWFTCSKDAYFDDEVGGTVVEVEKPQNPRYPFSFLARLASENIDIERRGYPGYDVNADSSDWQALL